MNISYYSFMTTEAITHAARTAGRPREFDMEKALDAALVVFSERGYQAASISDLTEATGLTAGSIYKAFEDKRGLFLATFNRYCSERNAMIMQRIAPLYTGREKIRAVLTYYAEHSHGTEGKRGCLVVGSAHDLALLDAEAAQRVAEVFSANLQRLKQQIVLAQSDGSVRADFDADTTARSLLCLTMGMRVLGKTGQTTKEDMQAVADTAMKILD